MKIAITDASIFIDLIHLNWIRFLFKLDYEIVTTYDIITELYDWQQTILEELAQEQKLVIRPAPDSELTVWKESVGISRGLSRPDLTVLWLAIQMNAMVLTGDKLVRTASARLNLDVHGILWLFDQFLERQLVSHSEACRCLETVMEINNRLPRAECLERLERWHIKNDP